MTDPRIARYTRLATAGAVASLPAGLAAPVANADIVYSDESITLYAVGTFATSVLQSQGGANAFTFGHGFSSIGGAGVFEVFGFNAENAVLAQTALGFFMPGRLVEGDIVSAGNVGWSIYGSLWGRFSSPGQSYLSFGNFTPNTGRGYVGFQFETAGGDARYGWAEFEVTSKDFIMHRWAYEDSGASINAGQVPAPGAIGLFALAAGAAGVRRKRSG